MKNKEEIVARRVRRLRLLVRLPMRLQFFLAACLGRALYWWPNRRKRIAATNLELCFPDLSIAQRKRLLKRNLISTAIGINENLLAWWRPEIVEELTLEVQGLEHLQAQLQTPGAPLMLTCHTTSCELGVCLLNRVMRAHDLPAVYMLARQHNNKALEARIQTAREWHMQRVIDKKDLRSVLKCLKAGHPVVYAPDQNFSYQVRHVRFFGVPAATTVAPARLRQSSQAVLLPWFCFRVGPRRWRIEIVPMPAGFDAGDVEDVLQSMNDLFEQHIRRHPEQYLWVHRRFKNQADGSNPYDR